jgi:hypothetical protein
MDSNDRQCDGKETTQSLCEKLVAIEMCKKVCSCVNEISGETKKYFKVNTKCIENFLRPQSYTSVVQ